MERYEQGPEFRPELVPVLFCASRFLFHLLLFATMPPRRSGGGGDLPAVSPFPHITPILLRMLFNNLARTHDHFRARVLYTAMNQWYAWVSDQTLDPRHAVRQALAPDPGGDPSGGASDAGESPVKKPSGTSFNTYDGTPQEKSLSEFLSDGNRFKRDRWRRWRWRRLVGPRHVPPPDPPPT